MLTTSEIAFCLTAKAHKEMVDAFDLGKQLEQYPGNFARIAVQKIFTSAKSKHVHEQTGSVMYHWDALPWHNESESVQLIQSFLAMLEDHKYLILRLGQDFDDVTRQGAYFKNPFGLHMTRCICFV